MGRSDPKNASQGEYAMLEPRVKHVTESTIRKKWKKLPAINHAAAREAILSSKDQSRSWDGKGAVDSAVDKCVQGVADILTERLPRIPFPPGTEELHFDHEANVNRISRMEEQLTANTHSMNLLRAQIAKEEELLKQDQQEVDVLDQSLRSHESVRRLHEKALHPIARSLAQDHNSANLSALSGDGRTLQPPTVASLLQDDDMRPVLEQLQSHLESMQYNMSGLRDIGDAMRNAGAELAVYT